MTRTVTLAGRRLLTCLRQAEQSGIRRLQNGRRTVSNFSTVPNTAQDTAEENLWVNSKFVDLKPVIGQTVPEFLREQMGPWGHLVAFVSQNQKLVLLHFFYKFVRK